MSREKQCNNKLCSKHGLKLKRRSEYCADFLNREIEANRIWPPLDHEQFTLLMSKTYTSSSRKLLTQLLEKSLDNSP